MESIRNNNKDNKETCVNINKLGSSFVYNKSK